MYVNCKCLKKGSLFQKSMFVSSVSVSVLFVCMFYVVILGISHTYVGLVFLFYVLFFGYFVILAGNNQNYCFVCCWADSLRSGVKGVCR